MRRKWIWLLVGWLMILGVVACGRAVSSLSLGYRRARRHTHAAVDRCPHYPHPIRHDFTEAGDTGQGEGRRTNITQTRAE